MEEVPDINANCKEEIPRLPQSVQIVDVSNSRSLNPQSSSGLLNQIGEFLGIFPNNGCKGTRSRSRISMDPQTSPTEMSVLPDNDMGSKLEDHYFIIRLPGTEIPKWLKLNHESDGNVISFWVGRMFPNIFDVCFAFGLLKYSWTSCCYVYLSINGREKESLLSTPTYEFSDHLWIFSLSNIELPNRLNESNPSEQNYVEVSCEMEDWVKNRPRRWGVRVQCICCSQKSDVFHCRVQVLRIRTAVGLPQSLFYPLLVVALIWINGLSIMEEILDIGQEETIDHSMPDIPENTTCPTSDGFESNSDSGNGALFQPFQVQRSCPGTFFFFIIHSLCLENQRKGNKQVLCVFCFVLFFFFLGNSRALREMEEIDPRAFNDGAEDSGLPIAHTYVNDGSNSKLYRPSKKARKSSLNLDAK